MKQLVIPFQGFYETYASQLVDDRAFLDYCNANDLDYNDVSELEGEDYDSFYDWLSNNANKYEKELATSYINNLAYELEKATGVETTFNELEITYPKQYNYQTNRLFVKTPVETLLALYKIVDKDIFKQVIKDNFTSYDGFWSFYDNDGDGDEWVNPSSYDHNQFEALIIALMKQYDINETSLYHND